MKTVLFADGDVGLEITRHLITHFPQDLAAVITTGDNPILSAARAASVSCKVFESSEADAAYIRQNHGIPELGVLAWWPRLIAGPLLSATAWGFVNTHPSLLPYNRGKHYNFWALVEQAPFGVTLHVVDDGIDSGDIVAQRKIDYGWQDNGGTLYAKAQQAMRQLFIDTYPSIRTGKSPRTAQDLENGSFHTGAQIEMASKIELDRPIPARDLLNVLRARTFAGQPACWFEDNGEKYEVRIQISRSAS